MATQFAGPQAPQHSLISASRLAARVRELATEIDQVYQDDPDLCVVVILDGAMIFAADLIRALKHPGVRIETFRASSYGVGTTSSNRVQLGAHPPGIRGLPTLIVEDIVDTGQTVTAICGALTTRSPSSLRVVTLLDKPSRRTVEVAPEFVGFTIPNTFVVGYGLDAAGAYRGLPDIRSMDAE